MKIDQLTMHSDDIGEVVGSFYGSPVREFDRDVVEQREKEDSLRITLTSMASRRQQ